MSRAFVAGLVAGLALLIVLGAGASRLKQKDPKQEKEEAARKQRQAELADATSVQPGVLTEKQLAHSRLFSYYRQLRGERTISFLARNAKDGMAGCGIFVGHGARLDPDVPQHYFAELSAASDAIIRGRPTKKTSQITEDDAFIFSDYDLVVTEVLKTNSAAPLEPGVTITVTRPGGKVVIEGIIVKATDDAFKPLPVNHDLLLFLKFIRETGAYQTTRDTGAFDVDGMAVVPLTKVDFPPGVLQDRESFLLTVRGLAGR